MPIHGPECKRGGNNISPVTLSVAPGGGSGIRELESNGQEEEAGPLD